MSPSGFSELSIPTPIRHSGSSPHPKPNGIRHEFDTLVLFCEAIFSPLLLLRRALGFFCECPLKERHHARRRFHAAGFRFGRGAVLWKEACRTHGPLWPLGLVRVFSVGKDGFFLWYNLNRPPDGHPKNGDGPLKERR